MKATELQVGNRILIQSKETGLLMFGEVVGFDTNTRKGIAIRLSGGINFFIGCDEYERWKFELR